MIVVPRVIGGASGPPNNTGKLTLFRRRKGQSSHPSVLNKVAPGQMQPGIEDD